mgnify:CR=1 FL=1
MSGMRSLAPAVYTDKCVVGDNRAVSADALEPFTVHFAEASTTVEDLPDTPDTDNEVVGLAGNTRRLVAVVNDDKKGLTDRQLLGMCLQADRQFFRRPRTESQEPQKLTSLHRACVAQVHEIEFS